MLKLYSGRFGGERFGRDEPRWAFVASLAEKLQTLLRVWKNPATQREYTLREVSDAIKQAGGDVSPANLSALLTGRAVNPTLKTLESLAQFFHAPPAFFFDDAVGEQVMKQLELLELVKNADMQELMLRAYGLSPDDLTGLIRNAKDVREARGLPEFGTPPQRPRRGRRWPKGGPEATKPEG